MTSMFDSDSHLSQPAVDTVEAKETPETKDKPKPEPKKTSRRRSGGPKRSRAAKVNVRQVAEKTQMIAGTPAERRDILAELIGAPSGDVVDLAVTILEAKTNPVADAIEDLTVIQESDLPRATVHLVGMSKDEHETLVRLLSAVAIGADLPEKVSNRSTEAALELIGPVRDAEVDPDLLESVTSLLDRG